jgi:hypothetical protein
MAEQAAVRDALTRERLTAAARSLTGVEVLGFEPDWWDGQSHVPCLLVRGGRRHRTWRVVETAGECVVVPVSRRAAERWLARRRMPARAELTIPAQRVPADIVLDAIIDVRRCHGARCGALLPIEWECACPICGTADEPVAAGAAPFRADHVA